MWQVPPGSIAASVRNVADGKSLVTAMIQAVWNDGDLEALGRYWSQDCINHADGGRRGLNALAEYHAGFASSFVGFKEVTVNVERQVAEGDLVVTHLLTTAHHDATGRRARLETIRIDRVREGRIVEHWSIADLAGLAAQLS